MGHLCAVTVLASLACLANPNGLDGALYPLQQLDMVGSAEARGYFGRVIWELQPPFDSMHPLVLGFFLVLTAVSGAAVALNWRRVRESDVLLWVAFLYLAIGARRNVALFAIVATPILVRNANQLLGARLQSLRSRADRPPRSEPRPGMAPTPIVSAGRALHVTLVAGAGAEGVGAHR